MVSKAIGKDGETLFQFDHDSSKRNLIIQMTLPLANFNLDLINPRFDSFLTLFLLIDGSITDRQGGVQAGAKSTFR